MTEMTARWQAAMMNNYGTPPLTLVRGSGAEVWDADGRRLWIRWERGTIEDSRGLLGKIARRTVARHAQEDPELELVQELRIDEGLDEGSKEPSPP